MEYTTLGKTGLSVSRMGFGGIPIQKVDASVTHALMERLAQRGVNYIDTARGYTVSEQFLGEALEGGLREKFVVATKSMARTKEDMARDIDISLKNLRTDYIDLYQIQSVHGGAGAGDCARRCAGSADGSEGGGQDSPSGSDSTYGGGI